ncbi:hypothetical protein TGAMA5MH_05473 [Trichoderma gamsii]|uniref:Uncharacterized protein n=1 Tax=Trichoderma gamsii TaxID=398673 RepID=A0A2K0TB27_9HYPO|nr:hypothetical protein TGAMA5MH_05473 [Trichoderma gamsii]
MPPRGIDTPGKGRGFSESSQVDVENPATETPTASSLPRAQDQEEYQDSDGEDQSVTDGADGTYQESITSNKPRIILQPSRCLRSKAAKQAPTQQGLPTPSQIETPNSRKRSGEKHDDATARPEKRGKKPAVDPKIKKYEKAFDEWLEDYKSKTQSLETLKTKNQELHRENDSLKKDLKQLQQDQKRKEASQQSHIAQLQSECSKLRRKLEAAIDAAKQDSGKYTKVSDSDIAAGWGKLCYNIRDIVSQCLTNRPANECDEIETLMKRMKKFLPLSQCNVASLRVAVLRRSIWYTIKSAVFSAMRPIWYGEAGQTLTQILLIEGQRCFNKPHCLKMLSQMKFRAIAGLNDGPQLDERAKGATLMLVEAAKIMLSPFIPDSMMDQFEAKMNKLIMDAVDLQTMMMSSKAIYFLRWLGDDDGAQFTPYNREMMESMQSDVDAYTSRYFVEFVEAPALIKYGNADGEGFEFHMILWKSSVILRELEVIPNSDDGSMHMAV